jgi:hypothetical protein
LLFSLQGGAAEEKMHFAEKFKASASALFQSGATRWPLACAACLLLAATFALGALAGARAVRRSRTASAAPRSPELASHSGSIPMAAANPQNAVNSQTGLAAKPSSQALLDLEAAGTGWMKRDGSQSLLSMEVCSRT